MEDWKFASEGQLFSTSAEMKCVITFLEILDFSENERGVVADMKAAYSSLH